MHQRAKDKEEDDVDEGGIAMVRNCNYQFMGAVKKKNNIADKAYNNKPKKKDSIENINLSHSLLQIGSEIEMKLLKLNNSYD